MKDNAENYIEFVRVTKLNKPRYRRAISHREMLNFLAYLYPRYPHSKLILSYDEVGVITQSHPASNKTPLFYFESLRDLKQQIKRAEPDFDNKKNYHLINKL